MIKELFEKQKLYLDHFFERIDHRAAEGFLELFYSCKGVIFFTGVGKSGLVAKKIATTMTSFGTKALYLSPVDALHGDIGMLSEEDLFVMLSKSGESDELLHLIPYLRNKKCRLASITCQEKSRLEKASDIHITLPLKRELCPFDLAPTTSSCIQMLFGDVLATALMQKKEVQLLQYRMNHPAGRIGKRLSLRVKDLMLSEEALPLCLPGSKLVDELVQLSDKRCGCLIIADEEGSLLGIFTDGDLRRALQERGPSVLSLEIEKLMTPTPKWTGTETLAVDALRQMESDQKHPVSVLPVLDEKRRLIGLVRLHDIIQSGV